MGRILIGWEIGSGYGHVERCVRHAAALRDAGHEVRVALRAPHPSAPDAIPAPSWPGNGRPVPSVSMGAVLEQIGVAVPGQLRALVAEWERILADERPDVVIADFAPALLTAARGRTRTILIGNGYDCPPSDMDAFPALRPGPAHDETEARSVVGAPLPSLFAADHVVVGALPWIDPYGSRRPGVHLPPAARTGIGAKGKKAFVYWHGPLPAPLVQGLARSGAEIRMWNPAQPTPWHEIAADSRIVVSHGGCGFTTQAALAGIPHLVVSADLEKYHYGSRVRDMGIGDWRTLAQTDATWVEAAVSRLVRDSSLHARAQRTARRMRATITEEPVAAVARLAE